MLVDAATRQDCLPACWEQPKPLLHELHSVWIFSYVAYED